MTARVGVRVLVCGSRTWRNRWRLWWELDELDRERGPLTIIAGTARGADALAAQWARVSGRELVEYPADWRRDGKAAGPIRNRRMLEDGKPEAVVAFARPSLRESRGTAHMVRIARAAGVPVRVIEEA